MMNKYNAPNSTTTHSNDEQRLQYLLRQHEQISEEIISIVLKTTTEAESLIQTLDRQLRTRLIRPDRRAAVLSTKIV